MPGLSPRAIVEMIEVLKTVAETKGGGGQQTDLLGMVALLKELSPKPVDSIGVLMQGIQMAQSFGEGKRGDDDGLSGVLSKLGVPLMVTAPVGRLLGDSNVMAVVALVGLTLPAMSVILALIVVAP